MALSKIAHRGAIFGDRSRLHPSKRTHEAHFWTRQTTSWTKIALVGAFRGISQVRLERLRQELGRALAARAVVMVNEALVGEVFPREPQMRFPIVSLLRIT